MQRTISVLKPFHAKTIAAGVSLAGLHPGGVAGPDGEVLRNTPGGQTWTEVIYLGQPDDDFKMMVPDIRMPANQYWPLHWHDCWTAVLVVEGSCAIGDWWMKEGDVFLTIPSLEYGPMLIGPGGCRLFEIFAQAHLSGGAYALEYRDHPTLVGSPGREFQPRSALNQRNEGRQVMPCDAPGIWCGRLEPGAVWNMGECSDPDRGVMRFDRLASAERVSEERFSDWHAIFVLAGEICVDGHRVARDQYLMIAPGATLSAFDAESSGADLLRLSRTARARP